MTGSGRPGRDAAGEASGTGAPGGGVPGGGLPGGGPRILLAGGGTGGHLYPALNLAAALRRAEPAVELFLLGARRGLEARVLPGSGLPYRLLPFQPIWRRRPWRNWRLIASVPAVVEGLAGTFSSFDPHLVVGTGGYASGPAILWARLAGRRIAIQEQNAEPGLVTRWLARWADQVHLGYPEAEGELTTGPRTRVFAHGNPVATFATAASEPNSSASALSPAGLEPSPAAPTTPRAFEWPEGRILLVAGGSQGARGINERLLADLEGERATAGPGAAWPLPEDVALVWVAGPAHAAEVTERADRLPWAGRIRVVPFIEGLAARLGRTSLAVARAGAMFVAELAAAGVPSVLVPFPAAAGGHQTANARAMEEAGAAVVREEAELQPGELLSLAAAILGDEPRRRRMAEAARARGAPDAADRIAAELLALARGSS